jgi:hypothetical protein
MLRFAIVPPLSALGPIAPLRFFTHLLFDVMIGLRTLFLGLAQFFKGE